MFKNISLSILCVFCINFTAKAQFSVDEDSLFADGWVGPGLPDLYSHTKIRNTKNSLDTIIWTRIDETLTPNWTSAVCDINLCHGVTVNTSEFILDPMEVGQLSFHFYPGMDKGTGKMIVRFSRKSEPTYYIDVLTNCQAYGLSVNSVRKTALRVYPNPATNMITIGDLSVKDANYEIFNMMGEVVLKNAFTGAQQVDVSSLAKGVYIVTVKDDNALVSGKLIIE